MRRVQRRRKLSRRFVICLLSLIVAVATASALMLPALTMDNGSQYETEGTERAEAAGIDAADTAILNKSEESGSEALSEADSLSEESVLIEGPQTMAIAAASAGSSWNTNSVSITARLTLNNAQLEDGQFSFQLIDASTDEVLQTTTNDAAGNIVFEPVSYSKTQSGIYQYKIKEVNDGKPGFIYDSNVYTVSVGVEKGAASPQTLSQKYYGVRSQGAYGWYMGDNPGDTDYFVYCIDATKPSPGSTAVQTPYWIAEPDPDNEMLRAAVCRTSRTTETGVYVPAYDGWKDSPSLKENLEKILYTVTYGSLKNIDGTFKAQLMWWATSGRTYLDNSKYYYTYADYMDICMDTTVPDGYELLLFHSSDGIYQPFVTLVKSTEAAPFQKNQVTFENSYIRLTTSKGTENVTAAIKAMKTLDGRVPGTKKFKFQLSDSNGNVIQTKENDFNGNIVFDPITFSKAGTYKYTIKEVDDGQSGIVYDTKTINATITVSSSVTEIEGEVLDGGYMKESATNSYFYMTDTRTGKDYKVFCLNRFRNQPTGESFLATTDVSDARIQAALTYPSEENLLKVKKVMYYFNLHPDAYSDYIKQLILWQATGTDLGTQQGIKLADELTSICSSVTGIPSNFHTVFFDCGDSSYQCLLYSYITPDPVVTLSASESTEDAVFENRISYELPAAGGIGTIFVTLIGLILMTAAMMYMSADRKRSGGAENSDRSQSGSLPVNKNNR